MEILQSLVLCGLFFIIGNVDVTRGQACDSRNYTLDQNPRRSTMAVYDSTVDVPLCDDGLNEARWYRFLSHAGETVVEKAANDSVPTNRCGTLAPIYIRGLNSHPSLDLSTLDATVCAHFGGDPCNWMETIQIHRCPALGNESVYFLYKLKAPPGCDVSYCVGDKPPCFQGEYWNGSACVNYFPPMTGFPLFGGPYTRGSGLGREVYFTCSVQYAGQPSDQRARFRITFLFDGGIMEHVNPMNDSTGVFEELPSFYLTAANSSTQIVLGENYLRGRLGREISCKAESFWEGYEPASGPSNATKLSQTKYYAAMESDYSTYVFNPSQGSTLKVVFRSTLPFTCRHCINERPECCHYNFRMKSSDMSGFTCSVTWTTDYTANAPVRILPGQSQSPMLYGMTFEPYNGDFIYGSDSLWRDYLIPPVMVQSVPSSTSYLRCRSTNDPYIYTFDGPVITNTQVGDFSLVRASHSMEVQVRQEVCSHGSCNCGVIVREGNSAFKISICEKGPWNATVQRSPTVTRLLSQDPVDSSTVYRDGAGKMFSIRMPSGLRVEFDARFSTVDIYVYLPPVYHRTTSMNSMCGNSNGAHDVENANNLNGFRISGVDNYFRSQPRCSLDFSPPVTRCDCQALDSFKCSDKDDLLRMVSKPQDPLPDRWNTGVVCHQTGIFATATTSDPTDSDFILDPEVVYPPYSYDPNHGVNVSFTWPTLKGKTEANVTQYCEDMVQSSPVYQDCKSNINVSEIITACKTDIQVMDEWLPGGAYVSALEEICVNELAAIINSSDADSNSTFITLTSVYEKTCTNQCNGHGTCIEAKCVCDTDYIGTDCGILKNQRPLLTSIIRNGVCDVRLRPCDVISVFGDGIAPTAALKCRFMDQSTGSYVETNGTFITSGEYSCPVPGTTTHRRRRAAIAETTAITTMDVSMTMNGVVYSNIIPFVLFDSTCMQCNDSRTCNQRSEACTINGLCYVNATRNTNNHCLQCLPERSTSAWTDTTVVQEWEPCTRQCDYGARSRTTVCSDNMENTEVELCKVTDCPEKEDEKHEGVGFTFSKDDLEKILVEPDKIFNPITDVLNSYCSRNAVVCCLSVGISSTSATSVSYTSSDLTTYAVGYPALRTSDTEVRIIVKIDETRLRADCTNTNPLSSRIVYAQPKLIYDAVAGAKTDLEQVLGVTVKSIWSPETVTSKPDSNTSSTASATFSSLFPMIGTYLLLKKFCSAILDVITLE